MSEESEKNKESAAKSQSDAWIELVEGKASSRSHAVPWIGIHAVANEMTDENLKKIVTLAISSEINRLENEIEIKNRIFEKMKIESSSEPLLLKKPGPTPWAWLIAQSEIFKPEPVPWIWINVIAKYLTRRQLNQIAAQAIRSEIRFMSEDLANKKMAMDMIKKGV